MQRFQFCTFFFLLILILNSCTKDQLPPSDTTCDITPNYQTDIKPIIDESCAYNGCHVSGFAKGNYTSYATMKPQLESGIFQKWVLINRQMPPIYAPNDKPKSLTEEQIDLIKCWSDAGYPEQ